MASLYEVGKRPVYRDSLKREHKGVDNLYASSRRMRLVIPSGPDAFPLERYVVHHCSVEKMNKRLKIFVKLHLTEYECNHLYAELNNYDSVALT